MQQDLMAFWGIAVAIFSFLLGTNMRELFERNIKNKNRIIGVTDTLLLLSLFAWLLLYLYSTWFETKGLALVFSPEQLGGLGVNVSFLLMAFSLAVFFAILIAYHNNILVVCVMALLLGVVDTYGNFTLMSGMFALAAQSAASATAPDCAETIWHYYYLRNPQLQRILIYMVIIFVALLVSIYREKLKGRWNYNFVLNFPKYLVILAIILNETTMLSWRIEREDALSTVNQSYYFQWSPYSTAKSLEPKTEPPGPCPLSL